MTPLALIPGGMLFCAGLCFGLGLATHELNSDFRKLSFLMGTLLAFGAGIVFVYLELVSGQ